MTVEEAFYSLATADAAVEARVGTRVYPTQAPAGATFPLLVYQEADRRAVMTHQGPKRTNSYDLTVTAWGESYAAAKGLAKAIRDALLGYRGTQSTVRVLGVFDVSEADDSEIPQHGDERGLFAVSMTFNLWFRDVA